MNPTNYNIQIKSGKDGAGNRPSLFVNRQNIQSFELRFVNIVY
jgi:hypothetical protein